LEILVDEDAVLDCEPRLLGDLESRSHSDAYQHEARVEPRAIIELRAPLIDSVDLVTEMEHDAVRLVQLPDEIAEHRPEGACERTILRGDDVHLHPALTQRRGTLESDKARADDHGTAPGFETADDPAAVRERAQRPHMRQIGPGNAQPHGLCAGCDEKFREADRTIFPEQNAMS